MALIRITIDIKEDVDIALIHFDKIQVWRAETRWGAYTEATSPATRIDLATDQQIYDFDDYDSSEFFWYRWRFYNSTGAAGNYSEPFQGYTPGTTYCSYENMKRILNTGYTSGKIRFSDAFKNLRKANDEQDVDLTTVTIGPSYYGQEDFAITFLDATNFKVEVGEGHQLAMRLIGTGDISTDFVADDYSVRIKASDWSGVPVAGDQILFTTDSHMSMNDAVQFINDAEIFADMIIEENIGFTELKRDELRFARDEVPKGVRQATARIAAFFIYSSIYHQQSIPGLPNNINDISNADRRDDLSSWIEQAKRYLQGFIKKYSMFFDPETGDAVTTAPRWQSMDTLFDGVGVYGVGEGLKLPALDEFKEQTDMSYAGLLDWDLLEYYIWNSWDNSGLE